MKIIRVLLLLLFTFQAVSSHALNRKDLVRVSKRYGIQFSSIGKGTAKGAAKAVTGTAKIFGHQLQTIVLIMVLSGVDLVKQHYRNAELTQEDIDSEKLKAHVVEAADVIINSGEVYSAMGGALAVGPAVAALRGVLEDPNSKSFLRKLLITGISTVITFVGWELGGELYTQARRMLTEKHMYEASESFGSLFLAARRNGPNSYEQVVVDTVLANMYQILFENEKQRSRWVYNTWRNRIATGEFVTLVTAMAGASAAGTTLFPGAGTLWGMAFGLVGGTAAILIPDRFKEPITDVIRKGRRQFWSSRMNSGYSYKKVRASVMKIVSKKLVNDERVPGTLEFPQVEHNRQVAKYLDTYFEALYDIEIDRLKLHKEYQLAYDARNFRSVIEIEHAFEELDSDEKEIRDRLYEFCKSEFDFMREHLSKNNLMAYYNDRFTIANNPILYDIFDAYDNSALVLEFIILMDGLKNTPEDHKLYFELLGDFKFYGYDEGDLISILLEKNLE